MSLIIKDKGFFCVTKLQCITYTRQLILTWAFWLNVGPSVWYSLKIWEVEVSLFPVQVEPNVWKRVRDIAVRGSWFVQMRNYICISRSLFSIFNDSQFVIPSNNQTWWLNERRHRHWVTLSKYYKFLLDDSTIWIAHSPWYALPGNNVVFKFVN